MDTITHALSGALLAIVTAPGRGPSAAMHMDVAEKLLLRLSSEGKPHSPTASRSALPPSMAVAGSGRRAQRARTHSAGGRDSRRARRRRRFPTSISRCAPSTPSPISTCTRASPIHSSCCRPGRWRSHGCSLCCPGNATDGRRSTASRRWGSPSISAATRSRPMARRSWRRFPMCAFRGRWCS